MTENQKHAIRKQRSPFHAMSTYNSVGGIRCERNDLDVVWFKDRRRQGPCTTETVRACCTERKAGEEKEERKCVNHDCVSFKRQGGDYCLRSGRELSYAVVFSAEYCIMACGQ